MAPQLFNRVRAEEEVVEASNLRLRILTKEVLGSIPTLVQQGLSKEAIAARLGCTAGTLKVRCSQAQISLRLPQSAGAVVAVPLRCD